MSRIRDIGHGYGVDVVSGRIALATGLTPSAMVHSTATPHTDEWYAARREGITATDVPKIVGSSNYGNALSVYLDKLADTSVEDASDLEAAEWGLELEPVIMRVWGRRHGGIPVMQPETLKHKGERWLICNLDRIAVRCPIDEADGKPWGCGVEIKTRSSWTTNAWRDDMPDDVLAQVAIQRFITGYPHIHVVCLIGGQRLVEFTYRRDDDLEGYLVAEARKVWDAVQAGEPPTVTADDMLVDILNRLYPNREGIVDVDPAVAAKHLDAYETNRLAERAAKADKGLARAELVQLLGDGEVALIDGQPAYTYKASTSGTRTLRIAADYRKED